MQATAGSPGVTVSEISTSRELSRFCLLSGFTRAALESQPRSASGLGLSSHLGMVCHSQTQANIAHGDEAPVRKKVKAEALRSLLHSPLGHSMKSSE